MDRIARAISYGGPDPDADRVLKSWAMETEDYRRAYRRMAENALVGMDGQQEPVRCPQHHRPASYCDRCVEDNVTAQAAAHGEEIKRLAEALAGVRNVSDDKTREIERQAAAHGESVRELQVRVLKLEAALEAASHALRSYQFSNSSPDLAQATADRLDALLAEVGK